MNERKATGSRGEDLAVEYLKGKGYGILCRNYTLRKSEIDIIAQKEDWLLFVEVKTRSTQVFGNPEEFVNDAQAARIMRAAEEFIHTLNWNGNIRFDIISVHIGDVPVIDHFEDAIN